jgi:hypothetical protein
MLLIIKCMLSSITVYFTYRSWVMALFLLENREYLGFWILFKVWLNQTFSNYCGVFHIYRSWIMTLFLLEIKDFLGFRMIFKVWLNQIFSNFDTMLWIIKYRLSLITVYFTCTVPELWPFFS